MLPSLRQFSVNSGQGIQSLSLAVLKLAALFGPTIFAAHAHAAEAAGAINPFDIAIVLFLGLAIIGVAGMIVVGRRMRHPNSPSSSSSQSGNIFFVLFGAVAMVGVLAGGLMTFMKGPLATSVKVTRMNTAETQMNLAAQIAVSSAASQANDGDCDADMFVEPLEWRDAGALPKPTNGGLIPAAMGVNKTDPWKTDYGYCVWDHGAVTDDAGCGGNTQKRLKGANADGHATVAIISAGPNRVFETTCNDFVDTTPADGTPDDLLLDRPAESDDMITQFSYAEAAGASGGLWSLIDADTAGISKDLEVTGGIELSGALNLLSQGLVLPGDPGDNSVTGACSAANDQQLRRNTSTSPPALEICDFGGAGWTQVSGGGGDSQAFDPDSECDDPTDAGNVRYDAVTAQPQFCNGTAWQPFALGTPTASIIILPASDYAMNITGPCVGGECPWKYTGWVTLTVRNQGQTASPALSVPTITGANPSNFEIDTGTSTCDETPVLAVATAAGNSCTIVVRAKAQGNGSYSAQINVVAGALSVSAPLYGVASSFGCSNGGRGWGGIIVGNCSGAGGTEPGTGQLIIQEAGCGTSTFEPTCTGNPLNDPTFIASSQLTFQQLTNSAQGDQNMVDVRQYPGTYPSTDYCYNLVKDGYDNWYLPSVNEMSGFYSDVVLRPNFRSGAYGTSTFDTSLSANYFLTEINMGTGAATNVFGNMGLARYIRCVRKHNTALPAQRFDRDPLYTTNTTTFAGVMSALPSTFLQYYTTTTSSTVQSSQIYVVGYNTPITISSAGSGSPEFRINGGAWVTSATAPVGNTILELRVTSAGSAGVSNAFTLTVGDDVHNGFIRTQDPSIVYNMFVTSTTQTANLGGVAGADNICQTQALGAGLAGGEYYKAYLSTGSNAWPHLRVSWKFGSILNMAGQTVFTNHNQLFDTSYSFPALVNRTAGNAVVTGNAFVGIINPTGTFGLCSDPSPWTTTAGTSHTGIVGSNKVGHQFDASGAFVGAQLACSTLNRLYCIGPDYETGNPCTNEIRTYASKNAPGAYTVVVPPNCTVVFKLWGGGAGSCGASAGGGGGYATYSETLGGSPKTYWYYVGGGGGQGFTSGCALNPAGGTSQTGFTGGQGGRANSGRCNGGGAGASILRETDSTGTILAIAAGGGGGRFDSPGKAGGQAGNVYFAGQTVGSNGVDDTVGTTSTPGGGGGYNGAGGGGGDTTAVDVTGMGGGNWALTGPGITSSTAPGAGGTTGNNGDTDKTAAGFGSNGLGGNSAAGFNGGVIVKW